MRRSRRLRAFHARPLAELATSEGALEVRQRLRAEVGPRACKDALVVLWQAFRHGAREGWIEQIPEMPAVTNAGERLRAPPRFAWVSESDFRAARAALLEDAPLKRLRRAAEAAGCRSAEELVRKRQVYLSMAFYTGLHSHDLDRLDDSAVSMEMGCYRRRNTKSARCVPDEYFEMPEQLREDLLDLSRWLGRPFLPGEAIGGGPWPHVSRELTRAARAAGVGVLPLNPRILRRSCAREYCIRGWDEREVAAILGHVTTQMVREIYVRYPVRLRSAVRVPWTIESRPVDPRDGQVIDFPRAEG